MKVTVNIKQDATNLMTPWNQGFVVVVVLQYVGHMNGIVPFFLNKKQTEATVQNFGVSKII